MSHRWDSFFKEIAETAAKHSLCLNRKIGAVIVRSKRIVSTGYNGPPEGVPPCSIRPETDQHYKKLLGSTDWSGDRCPRYVIGHTHGLGRELCPATHAEENAIINAARLGVSTKDCSMYLTCGLPCKHCLGTILNAGIAEIICTSYEAHDDLTLWLLSFSLLSVRLYD